VEVDTNPSMRHRPATARAGRQLQAPGSARPHH
jgi:hypothetical protein